MRVKPLRKKSYCVWLKHKSKKSPESCAYFSTLKQAIRFSKSRPDAIKVVKLGYVWFASVKWGYGWDIYIYIYWEEVKWVE